MQNQDKPPIGIMPEYIWKEKRMEEIKAAMFRYEQENKKIPKEWYTEYYSLTGWLNLRNCPDAHRSVVSSLFKIYDILREPDYTQALVDKYYHKLFAKKQSNMKPFNLEKALAGESVVTRSGNKVKIAGYNPDSSAPLLGWLLGINGWDCWNWEEDGKTKKNEELSSDLFMAPVKKKGWVNVYPVISNIDENAIAGLFGGSHNVVFKSEKIAKEKAGEKCIATVPIEWEE